MSESAPWSKSPLLGTNSAMRDAPFPYGAWTQKQSPRSFFDSQRGLEAAAAAAS